MAERGLEARVAELLGTKAVEALGEVACEGAQPALRVAPTSGEELAALLGLLNDAKTPALVRGGGTRLGLGHPVPAAEVLLETTALAVEPIVDSEDGVAYLPAGKALSELCEHVHKEGEGRWELPFDPSAADSTLGGALATAALGPRSGLARDAVLGLHVVLASGERTRCGGRVVKNVTGYDLAKLYVGSLGSLGVIEAAWLRLRPAPERRELWALPLPASGLAAQATGEPGPALTTARLPSVSAAGWFCAAAGVRLDGGPEGEGSLWIELAGDAAAVEADCEVLRAQRGASPVSNDPGGSDPWRVATHPSGLDFRISCVASGIAPAVDRLPAGHAAVEVDLRHGIVRAHVPPDSPVPIDAAFEAVADAARLGGGDWRLEAGPVAVRRERDVFGDATQHASLFRALKAQYDPRGILNPGRQAGRT